MLLRFCIKLLYISLTLLDTSIIIGVVLRCWLILEWSTVITYFFFNLFAGCLILFIVSMKISLWSKQLYGWYCRCATGIVCEDVVYCYLRYFSCNHVHVANIHSIGGHSVQVLLHVLIIVVDCV